MAISHCTQPVAVVIFAEGQEQFLPVEDAPKLLFMWRIETIKKTSLSCTIAVSLLYWILGICQVVPLTGGFMGEIY